MSVDVIIVNYKTKELTADAVASVLNEKSLGRVIVVDNHSGDDSAAYLKEKFRKNPVDIIASTKNLGFGGGNNKGVSHSKAKYIFLLNSDASIEKGCLETLKKDLEKDPKLGMVAPAVYLEDGKTLQADAQGIFPTVFNILTRKVTKKTEDLEPDWVSGVAFMARREEFVKLGSFDEKFFMYLEDVDLCRRYREAGFKIKRNLEAKIIHLGGRSKQSTKRQKSMYFKSQDYYLKVGGSTIVGRWVVKLARIPYLLVGKLFLWK